MGADIKSLRSRIKSIDSTLHLTKAMGLVASSKIRRATEAMRRSRQYLGAIDNAVDMLTSSPECAKSPYMNAQEGGHELIVAVAGDRGLAGGYSANVFRLAKQFEGAEFIGIGKKACEHFEPCVEKAESFSYVDAAALSKKLCDGFAEGRYSRVGFISSEYVSMMSQQAKIRWILPLEKTEAKSRASVIFEPDEISVLNAAVCEYVAAILIAGVYESFACEVAARRVAMDSAGKNAQQMIDTLNISYNRARQGAITQEITEIVAGSGS